MATKVRVNLANPIELQEIPGIGPAQAAAIVKHRSEHGPIRSAQELVGVLGERNPRAEWQELDYVPADATAPEAPGA